MPDAIAIGPLIVPVLRMGAVLALVLGGWVAYLVAQRWRLEAGRVGTTAEWAVYAFVAGARLGFVAANWEAFAAAPWTALYLWQPGYDPLVGVVAAVSVAGVRVAVVTPAYRRYHLSALGTGALVAVVAYAGVAGVASLDLRPGSVRVGDSAPAFVLRDLEGREAGSAQLEGRPVVLNFWATWCPPCRREMPALDAVYRDYREAGLLVVGVDVGEGPFVVERFLAGTPVSYPIWVDAPRGASPDTTQDLLQRFGGVGLPTTVFIDAQGTVRKIRVGELSRAVVEAEVEAMLP